MKKSNKLFVNRYVPYSKNRKKTNYFTVRLISITAVICTILLGTIIFIANQLPDGAFTEVLFNKSKKEIPAKELVYIFPKPDKITRAKADRLREIRYEDYLAHCYTPQNTEMDNVYIYDTTKKCYLTFDDGPSKITPQILDILKQYKVKATFFVQGHKAEANPDLIKQIYLEGHSIGNHTYSHDYSSVYNETKESFQKEVTDCRDAINKALGKEYKNLLFRFPGGYNSLTNETTKTLYRDALEELGYKYIDWNCLTGDSNTEFPTEEYLMNTLMSGVPNSLTGDIVVLLHDSATKQITADTLPKVIEYIYEQGYEFSVLTNQN